MSALLLVAYCADADHSHSRLSVSLLLLLLLACFPSLARAQLSGFPHDWQYGDLVGLVNKNMSGYRYSKLTLTGDSARLYVNVTDAAPVLQALNGLQIRPGMQLHASLASSYAGRNLTASEKELLRAYVRSAYDSQHQVLNLSGMIAQGQIASFVQFNSTSFTSELLSAMQSSAPQTVTLNLGGNQISSLQFCSRMKAALPHLTNLSLQNNSIASIEQLEHLSAYRDRLRELLLSNNPFFATFTSAPGAAPQQQGQIDYAAYPQYVSSLFPALQVLDHQPVQGLIEFDLPANLVAHSTQSLPPLRDSFFDTPAHAKMSQAFVQRYFDLFDRDRQQRDFISVYADNAQFSLTYTSDSRYSNSAYSAQNRDISKLGSSKMRASTEAELLKLGPVAILSAFQKLPHTKHDIGSFVADVFKVPTKAGQGSMLSIVIRGQFLEAGECAAAQ